MAQMFQVVWTGNPIANESIFKDAPTEYMETARKVFELEKKMAFASPDPDAAQEITVSHFVQSFCISSQSLPGPHVLEYHHIQYCPT